MRARDGQLPPSGTVLAGSTCGSFKAARTNLERFTRLILHQPYEKCQAERPPRRGYAIHSPERRPEARAPGAETGTQRENNKKEEGPVLTTGPSILTPDFRLLTSLLRLVRDAARAFGAVGCGR